MANHRYNNFLRRESGQYKVLSIQLDTLTIGEDAISKTVSIDRLTLSPSHRLGTDNPHEMTLIMRPGPESQQQQNFIKNTKDPRRNATTVLQGYMGNHELCHVHRPRETRSVVSWYGYGPGDDALKPLHHIPTDFARRKWNGLDHKRQHAMNN